MVKKAKHLPNPNQKTFSGFEEQELSQPQLRRKIEDLLELNQGEVLKSLRDISPRLSEDNWTVGSERMKLVRAKLASYNVEFAKAEDETIIVASKNVRKCKLAKVEQSMQESIDLIRNNWRKFSDDELTDDIDVKKGGVLREPSNCPACSRVFTECYEANKKYKFYVCAECAMWLEVSRFTRSREDG